MTEIFRFRESDYKDDLDYPDQFVSLLENKAVVGIDEENTLEISRNLGRLIQFLMKLRDTEGDRDLLSHTPLSGFRSETFKRLVLLSNCHRVMMVLFGFKPKDVQERDAGSEIITEYFLKNRVSETSTLENIENRLSEYKKEDFPLALNFFMKGNHTEVTLPIHSVMVLGKLPNGKYLCFHKEGIGDNMATCFTTLDRINDVKMEFDFTLHSNKEVSDIYDRFKANNSL
jgi:hypothetical protein